MNKSGETVSAREKLLAYAKALKRLVQRNPMGVRPAVEEIRTAIISGKPKLVSRFGTTELQTISRFVHPDADHAANGEVWSEQDRINARALAGIFPADTHTLTRFCNASLEWFHEIDLLGVRDEQSDRQAAKQFAPQAKLLPIQVLSPPETEPFWSNALKGRKVLVIHPFAKTIRDQFAKRALLFHGAPILPDMQLTVISAVQSVGSASESCGFPDWFAALASMKEQMERVDFDVLLVGAGAYGLPLAAHGKGMGKVALHVGGALQLLFGIRGQRWENYEPITRWRNESWTWPARSEVPDGADLVEGGCYWNAKEATIGRSG